MMMEPPEPGMKRITVRPNCPNPLFEQWLDEWRQEAAMKGSDMQYCFGKALKSLRKYPLPLKTGKECAILNSFGNRLCLLLDRKLVEYRKMCPEGTELESAAPDQVPSAPEPKQKKRSPKTKKIEQDASSSSGTEKTPSTQKRRISRSYVPAWRSGPYAILLTLFKQEDQPNYCGYMTKAELQREAQPLCDTSFSRPDPGSHYTAWSSMSLVVKKGLVKRFSNPAKFSLTDEGRQLAVQLQQSGEKSNSNENVGSSGYSQTNKRSRSPSSYREDSVSSAPPTGKPAVSKKRAAQTVDYTTTSSSLHDSSSPPSKLRYQSSTSVGNRSPSCKTALTKVPVVGSDSSDNTVILAQGNFDVILLVDTAETTGASKKRHDQTISELTQMKVPFEVRRLKVGDFVWIARHRSSGAELLLPYIVERKRMDDLGSSIKDNRFKEQKFRLKKSGLENLIYLVESYGSDQHVGLPLASVQQAAVNTQVVDGFCVKYTTDHRHSMAYLASLTRIIGRVYLEKTLISCAKKDISPNNLDSDLAMLITYKEFNDTTAKTRNFTVREMFIRQLIQLKGLSVDKAVAIVGRYPTPQSLLSAYQNGGDQHMLACIEYGASSRPVGPIVSKALYQLFTKRKL